ncbi:MAG: hypothetical protein HKN20_16295 [Gemmatimonadetes bacterium]|nr:hypothetical protein [Gemmatimonadota bacterium]
MKVTGNRNAYQANQAGNEPKNDAKKSAKKKAPSPQKSMADAAEGLTRSMNSRLNKLMKPAAGETPVEVKPDAAKPEHQARVNEGQLPSSAKPETSAQLPGGAQTPAGPASQYQIDEGMRPDHGPPGGDLEFTGPGKFSDGRGADGDVGSMETGIGNPHGGMDRGAAGKLPAHRQATIDAYKEKAFDAARNGNFKDTNRWASAVSQELGKGTGTDGSQPPVNDTAGADAGGVDPGAEGAEAEERDWSDDVVDKIKNGLSNLLTGKAAAGGKTPTQEAAEGIDAELDANAGAESKGLGEKERTDQAGEAAKESGGTNVDTSTSITNAAKKESGGVTEDRTPDSEGGPDIAREFTDQYQQMKMKAKAGSEVNPGDNVQGPANQFSHVDAEAYTGNYGEGGVHSPTEEEIEAGVQRAKEGGSIAPEAQ